MMKVDDWPPLDITKSQLLSELGRPNSSILSLVDGKSTETLTWVYARAESNPALFVPVVGLFVAASGEGMAVNSRSLGSCSTLTGKSSLEFGSRVRQEIHSLSLMSNGNRERR